MTTSLTTLGSGFGVSSRLPHSTNTNRRSTRHAMRTRAEPRRGPPEDHRSHGFAPMSRANIHPGLVDDVNELTPSWMTAALQHDGSNVVVSDVAVTHVRADAHQRRVGLHLDYED